MNLSFQLDHELIGNRGCIFLLVVGSSINQKEINQKERHKQFFPSHLDFQFREFSRVYIMAASTCKSRAISCEHQAQRMMLCNKQKEQREIEPDHIYQLCSRINQVKSWEINHVCPLQRGHMKPTIRGPKSSNYNKKMVACRGQTEGESQENQCLQLGHCEFIWRKLHMQIIWRT